MESPYDRVNHDLSMSSDLPVPNYDATSEENHLTPNIMMGPIPTPNYPSSAPSPLFLSSSLDADITPGGASLSDIGTDFRLEDTPNLLETATHDISSTLLNDIGYGPSAEGSVRTSVQPMSYLYCPSDVSSPDYLSKVKEELDHLHAIVQNSVTEVSHFQLLVMKSLVRGSYDVLETIIQEAIDSEMYSLSSTNSASCDKDRYLCRLCVPHRRKTYSATGTFRRHVASEHARRYKIFCPLCEWSTPRRDKIYDHFKHKHPPPERLLPGNIRSVRLNPPRCCPICDKSVERWDGYFSCVSEHCRLQNSSSSDSSAIWSRRNSDDSGSGGNGNNGHYIPGTPFGGLGPQTQFPNGDGSNSAGGGALYPSHGFLSYGNGYPTENSIAQLVGHKRLTSSGSTCDTHDALSDQESLSSPDLGKTHNKTGHEMAPFEDLVRKTLQKSPPPELHNSLPKQCKSCSHIMDTCVMCQLQKSAVDRCHLCADKTAQRYEGFHEIDDYDQYHDFACNGRSDRSRSARRIAWAIDQVSQAFMSKDAPCSAADFCKDPAMDTSTSASSVIAMDERDAPHASEQSNVQAIAPRHLPQTSSGICGVHTTQSHPITMTLASRSLQTNNQLGYFDWSPASPMKLSEGKYNTLSVTGDPSIEYEPNSRQAAASALTAEDTIPQTATQLKTVAFNRYENEIISARPSVGSIRSLPGIEFASVALEAREGTEFPFPHIPWGVDDGQSLPCRADPQDASPSAAGPLTCRRRSQLRRKLRAIIEILVLKASVTKTASSLAEPIVKSEQADLGVSTDIESSDRHFLPQKLRKSIHALAAVIVDNVDSAILAAPMHTVEEEIVWPKVTLAVDLLTDYRKTPLSLTVIEQQISEFRKLRLW
ncbi:hypothetical protein BDV28DRAFT_131363 [Aspergillus coremiiformis]|uniref:C2H2-type domain-containing protein n=1 Tax=Aspergillus coremiiformis TaxID=138285 RepID=A0A5N6ZBM0_9EURO|nr:hypothetical protein BDV28DRAFT_131363 [Aspergillus coremiiformis]